MGPKSSGKDRIDVIMVARGLVDSREQAKRLIMAGQVVVEGIQSPKPGQVVALDVNLELKEKERYVSRGGLKLEAALAEFGINLENRVCMDVGASTGGFTDCMLQHGAARVYAVDVGATQMHERLRPDSRVVLLEHTNARTLEPGLIPELVTFCATDVSFISVLRVSEPILRTLADGGEAVLLIKPQFEAGKEAVSRGKGIIRNRAVHKAVLQEVTAGLIEQGWAIQGLCPSPITGGSGNVEFLCFAAKTLGCKSNATEVGIAIDDALMRLDQQKHDKI